MKQALASKLYPAICRRLTTAQACSRIIRKQRAAVRAPLGVFRFSTIGSPREVRGGARPIQRKGREQRGRHGLRRINQCYWDKTVRAPRRSATILPQHHHHDSCRGTGHESWRGTLKETNHMNSLGGVCDPLLSAVLLRQNVIILLE